VTRIAIVAASDELRTRLAAALGADPGFEIVAVAAAEVVLVARTGTVSSRVIGRAPGDGMGETVLTNREREILALLAEGLGNKQIGGRLGISPSTVKTHLELMFEKLGVSSRAEAVATGVRRGLLLL
jgi:two-component system, NarL family, nitrate/nitrite response regulator NarL